MSPLSEEALLNGAIDGTLNSDQREQLHELLARSSDARARLAALEHAIRMVEEVVPEPPPDGLVRDVMNAIPVGHARGSHVARFTGGGVEMARKAMIGLAAAAALVLVIYAVTGYPPIGGGTEGNIGAAKRYQAQQLSDKDVVLGDTAVQAFLQSDVFDRVMKDDAARQLLSNGNFRAMLAEPGLLAVLSKANVAAALAQPGLAALFRSDVARAVAQPEFAVIFGQAKLLAALTEPAMLKAIQNPAVLRAMQETSAAELRGTDVTRAVNDAAVAQALRVPAVAAAIHDAELMALLSKPAVVAALREPAVMAAFGDAAFVSALRNTAVSQAFASEAFLRAMLNAEFQSMMSNYRAAIAAPALNAALNVAAVSAALKSSQLEAALAAR